MPSPAGNPFALGSSSGVLAADECAGEPTMHDDHCEVGRDRYRFDRE